MFGGGAGTLVARDSSPYGNNGTLTNFTWPNTATSGWTYVPELGRMGWVFDGANNYIAGSVNPALANLGVAGSHYTAAFWCKYTYAAEYGDFLDLRSSKQVIRFVLDTNHRTVLAKSYDGSNFPQAAVGNLQPTGTDPAWHHCCAVWRRGDTITPYFDGAQKTPANDTTTGDLTATGLAIGAQAGGGGSKPAMVFTDGAIWNRALTLPEIQTLANRSDPSLGGLILPPRRVMFPSAVAATPSVATSRTFIIGGGYGGFFY